MKSFVVLIGAVLLGGSLLERGDRADYWYRRFVEDRNLTPADLPRERYQEIQERYYDTGALAAALPPDHLGVHLPGDRTQGRYLADLVDVFHADHGLLQPREM